MKIGLICVSLLLLLCGCVCRQTPAETVNDDLTQQVFTSPEYGILVYIPSQAQEVPAGPDEVWRVFCHRDGQYRITTGSILADSEQSAIRQLTGREHDTLTVIRTGRFDLPEYHFAWHENGENHRADVVGDGLRYYAVIFSTPEEVGQGASDVMTRVFASFGLSCLDGGTLL